MAKIMNLSRYPVFLILFFLLSGCADEQQPLKQWQHSLNGSFAAALSENGAFALVSGYNEPAGWWDLNKNARLYNWRLSQNQDPIEFVAISKNNKRAVTASAKDFSIWNTDTGKSIGFYKLPTPIRAIAISRLAKSILFGAVDGRVIFLSMVTGRRLIFLGHRLHAQSVFKDPNLAAGWIGINSLDLSANGKYAISGGDDRAAIVWDTQTGQQLYLWPHKNRVLLVKFSPDGKLAFSASSQAEAYIWSLASGKIVSKLQLKSREWVISAARFSGDGKLLATGSPGRDLKVWNVTDGSLIEAFKVKKRFSNKASGAVVLDVSFAADGSLISEASSGYGEKWPLKPEKNF